MYVVIIFVQTLRLISSQSTTDKAGLFAKVDPRFPNDFNECLILTTRTTTKNYGCASLCLQDPNCHIFCVDGSECVLSSAYAAWHWQGIKEDPIPTRRCFSSSGSRKDIVPKANATGVVNHSNYLPTNVLVGYACYRERGYMYLGVPKGNVPAWWAADLGKVYQITSVRIYPRRQPHLPLGCSHIEVRVGSSNPGHGVFTDNEIFDTFEGLHEHGRPIYFTNNRHLAGSVVSIQCLNTEEGNLIFYEPQILVE